MGCSKSTVSSVIVRKEIALPHSPDANATIETARRPEVSISKSIACPKSRSVETRGLHVSLTAVTVCDSISLRGKQCPPISSGNARDSVDGFSVDGRSIRVDGDRTTVLVTPVYDMRCSSQTVRVVNGGASSGYLRGTILRKNAHD